MAKTTLEVSLVNRNIILKSESQAAIRQIARSILALKSEKLVKELGTGFIAGDKLIKITVTNAESDQSGVEVL